MHDTSAGEELGEKNAILKISVRVRARDIEAFEHGDTLSVRV
jgi:hypothetical protein